MMTSFVGWAKSSDKLTLPKYFSPSIGQITCYIMTKRIAIICFRLS